MAEHQGKPQIDSDGEGPLEGPLFVLELDERLEFGSSGIVELLFMPDQGNCTNGVGCNGKLDTGCVNNHSCTT